MTKTQLQHGDDLLNSIADALESAANLPGSRELSLAKTKLDEAIFWSGRAINNLRPIVNEKAEA